ELPVEIKEPGEVDAFRVSEVNIDRPIRCDFLLECNVGGIDSRVRIIFREYANASAIRECAGRYIRHWSETRPGGRRHAKLNDPRASKNGSLLRSVGSY